MRRYIASLISYIKNHSMIKYHALTNRNVNLIIATIANNAVANL